LPVDMPEAVTVASSVAKLAGEDIGNTVVTIAGRCVVLSESAARYTNQKTPPIKMPVTT
jgi:hypothetical protein